MDLNELKTFVAVVDLQSFSAAALKLNITQPAVSKRINNLEGKIGAPILDRCGRQIQPTVVGDVFYQGARKIINGMEDTLTEIKNLDKNICGSIKIASSHYAGLYYLPGQLKTYNTMHPEVELTVSFVTSNEAVKLIQEFDVEVALCTLPSKIPQHITPVNLINESLHIVVAKGHSLLKNKTVSVKKLANFTAIIPRPGDYTFDLVYREFSNCGVNVSHPMWTDSLATAKAMIETGLGWGLLPEIMINDNIYPIKIEYQQNFTRSLGLLINERRSLSNAARSFISLLKENYNH